MILNKKTISWAFYDWANSAFATTIMAGFFPYFFKTYWAADLQTHESTFQLGVANSAASLIVVLMAPLLGAIADHSSAKKRFLLFFAVMGIVMSGGLYFVAKGAWLAAIFVYVFATLGFMGGNIFYDSLIIEVAEPKKRDMVSALGFAFGYLGGGLLFALNVAMVTWPQWFGIEDATEAIRYAFVSVSIWWAVFSIPVLLFVKEHKRGTDTRAGNAIAASLRELVITFKQLRSLRITFLFLLAYWFYIDGVDTIVRMAVDYGISLGFEGNSVIAALLITQFVGFPAALVYGKLGERWGAKRAILAGIGIYVLVVLWATQMNDQREFYGLAIAIGLVQGGVQALSRSLYSTLIPVNRAAQFFGFYNMLGKFAAVIGPILMGWVSILTGSPRLSILSVLILFAVGAFLLWRLDISAGQKAAQQAAKDFEGQIT